MLLIAALPVERTSVSDAESDVFYAINGMPDALYWPLFTVMQLGMFIAIPVLSLIALATRRVRLALDLALSGTAAWLLAKVVKEIVQRGRPRALLEDVILRDTAAIGHGFVSGHTAVAVAMATVAGAYFGHKMRYLFWTLATIVGFSRIYFGAHLPLDVLGGAAMGWAVGSLIHLVLGSPTEEQEHPHEVATPAEEPAT